MEKEEYCNHKLINYNSKFDSIFEHYSIKVSDDLSTTYCIFQPKLHCVANSCATILPQFNP